MKTYVFSDEHNCDHTYVLAADAQRALDAAMERLKGQIDYSIKLQQLIESLRRDDTPSPELYHHKIIVEFKGQLATLQAQLPTEMPGCTILFKECEKGHGRLTATNWIDHGCGTCTVEQLQAQLAELRDGCEMMTHTAGTFQELWRGACDQREAMEAQLRQVEAERNTARHRVDELEAREIDVEILRGDLTTLRQLVEVHTKQLTELTIIPIGCSREQELRWTQSIKDLRAALAQDAGKVSTSIIGKQVPPSQWNKNAGVSGDVS